MSETEMMEPAPVSKDPALVNGSVEDIQDDIPPPEEPQVIKQPVESVNGIDHNGLRDEDHIPVNGDLHDELRENQVRDHEGGAEGDIVLPPPPEDMSGFPPPIHQQNMDIVEPVNVEPDENVGITENAVVDDNVMGESVESIPQVDSIGVDRVVEDVSEEELVSDEGVHDEVDLEKPLPPEPVVAEQPQLIDLGGEQAVSDSSQEPGINILDSPVPGESEMGLAHELAPEPAVLAPESVVQEFVPPPDEQESAFVEPKSEPQQVMEEVEQSGFLPEPEPASEQPQLGSEVVVQEVPPPAEEPVSKTIPPAQSEDHTEVAEGVSKEPLQEASRDVENDFVPSEPVVEQPPDIIAQTTEEPHEVQETPPPPPPPLVDETPPPPPPLDDSIQIKRDHRRSGEVTPKKESPEEPPALHLHEATPVAVVAPVMKAEEKVEKLEPPSPVPAPVPENEPVVVVPVTAVSETDKEEQGSAPVSPLSSPARSEGAGSEAALSEPQEVASPQVSQKINKKNFKNKIKFHVDLLEASLKQLSFLNTVNKHASLQEEWLYKQAIRRYEAFWLPLAVEHKKEHLAAPLDIEWVWHCHMLAPACYEADCTSLVGKVVDHKVYSEKERTKALEKSRKYWTAKYPNEPFEIELVYKEKTEAEPVVEESKTAQENETKEDSIPFVEDGTSEVEPKGNFLVRITSEHHCAM